MSSIQNYIEKLNESKKILSVFLTAGFPDKNNFSDLVMRVFEAGADMIELGIPFSDPLADGPVIQASSQKALDSGVNLEWIFETLEELKNKTGKPIILMGYANPIFNYGVKKFIADAAKTNTAGLIIPDIPIEEYDDFFVEQSELDIILLTTPTSSEQRIKAIDKKSSGFVYCVSVTGTTGARSIIDERTIENVKRTYNLIDKNKMLIGFGISQPEHIAKLKKYCDGVIVGSAVIKALNSDNKYFDNTNMLIKKLNKECF